MIDDFLFICILQPLPISFIFFPGILSMGKTPFDNSLKAWFIFPEKKFSQIIFFVVNYQYWETTTTSN